jgi:hypothetical protein
MTDRALEYAAWIDALDDRSIVGRCQPICEAMAAAFPELRLVGGYVKTPLGCDLHYWLVSPSGTIVDPTGRQFGTLAPEDYEDAGTTDAMALLSRFLVHAP